MSFQSFLKIILRGGSLDRNQAQECFHLFLKAGPIQQATFLGALSVRKESTDEILGFVSAFQEYGRTLNLPSSVDAIDIVGTGGDGLKTFNISTASSLLLASAGVTVCKHGGRAVTSASGSADVISALAIPKHENSGAIDQALCDFGFAFLWAPIFNPVLKSVSSLREGIGSPTILNIIGPLSNPCQIKRIVLGVYRKDLLEKAATVLQELGYTDAMVVRGHDGMDELSLCAPTDIIHLRHGKIERYTVHPEDLDLKICKIEDLLGVSPALNATLISEVLAGSGSRECSEVVMLNAAAGFLVAGRVHTLKEGVSLARRTLESGRCRILLERLELSYE